VRDVSDVRVEVIMQKGNCAAGHKVGDHWVCGSKTPAGVCAAAYVMLYPTIRSLMFGAKIPWAKPDGSVELVCADYDNPVLFKIKPV
jgi:uncharacterized repeat protein (TIGR04076 family)